MSQTALAFASLISVTGLSAADVRVARTTGTLTLSNASTKIVAELAKGRANGFSLVRAATDTALARIDIGGGGRWTAACTATSDGERGVMVFRSIDTSGTGGTPVFGERSEVRVEFRDSEPFPLVELRLGISAFDPSAWEMAFGGRTPVHFLAGRVGEATLFYQGGFQTPLPGADPFPVRSRSMRGDWDGEWTHAIALGACPVPALGLWNPAASIFVGYEFQEARGSDRSSKHIATAYCARLPKGDGGFCAMLVPQPEAGAEVASQFRLVHSTTLSSSQSVNELVLRHIWETYRTSLPAIPSVNDVGWMPRRDSFLPDDRTCATLCRAIRKNSPAEDAAALTDGSTVVSTDCRGVRNLFRHGDRSRQTAVRQQWEVLSAKAIRKTIGGDDCVFWRSPIDGDHEECLGGEAAATVHSARTWQVGASLIAMYQATEDASLLDDINGILKWTRHCTFTRGGDHMRPAATSAGHAARASADFLLGFYHAFKRQAERAPMAEEALSLGRAMLYRCLAIYTSDPDETDNLDPTFLVQANNGGRSYGLASWTRTDELIRAMALYCIETGDPVLRDLVHGALQRWHVGYERDGLHRIEDLDVYGTGPDTKGTRRGRLTSDAALAEYVQPVGDAKARILCGGRQALVFCVDTTASIDEYRFQEDGDLSFRLHTDERGAVEINVTAPYRNLRGRRVCLNGREAEAEVVGQHGENLVLRGVKNGDVISIGDIVGPPAKPMQRPTATAITSRYGDFRLLSLPTSEPSARPLSRSWRNGRSWAGFVDGVHHAWGVPFRVLPGPKAALDISGRSVRLTLPSQTTSVFVFATRSDEPLTAVVAYADGQLERHKLSRRLPALSPGPIRNWRIDVYPLRLRRPNASAESIELKGDALLFAVTAHPATCTSFNAVVARMEAKGKARLAELQAERDRELAKARIVPDSRAKVVAAVPGKGLRIAFIPPYEAFTEILRTACTTVGQIPAMLSPQNIADPSEFNAAKYPIAVCSSVELVLYTVHKPGDAAEVLKQYVKDGGCLIVAARGYPFYYPLALKNGELERIKGARHAQLAGQLEIVCKGLHMPRLTGAPRFELAPSQPMFTHLPDSFRFDPSIGGPYRPFEPGGLPKEDKLTPIMHVTELDGKSRELVAAVIDHNCERYKGGRVIFLWGNMLAHELGPTIALDLMTYAICTAKLRPLPEREPAAAILPREMAGHDKAILEACTSVGMKTHRLSVEEFVDPAVFNPRNFPVAIHAVDDESFLAECAGRSDVWHVYVDYVKSGGLLVACGNMWQFFYAGTLDRSGKWTKKHDPEYLILSALGLRSGFGFGSHPGAWSLKCLPDQDIVRFESAIPVDYIHWGRYRTIAVNDASKVKLTPIAQVANSGGKPFGGYAIAHATYPGAQCAGEVLWFWGELLNDARAYPLLDQAIKYVYGRRKSEFAETR